MANKKFPCVETADNNHAVTLEDMVITAGSGVDDTEALYLAVDKALEHNTHVQLDGKTYNFDQPIELTQWGTVVRGCGSTMTRQLSALGSVLNSRIDSGEAFRLSGQRSEYSNIAFRGALDGWLVHSSLKAFSKMECIFMDAAGASTEGIRITDSYTMKYSTMDIWKRNQNQVGRGLWHDTASAYSGGLLEFDNITASYFDQNLEFGQEDRFVTDVAIVNKINQCQGRHGNTGMRIGSGYMAVDVDVTWCEFNSYANVQIHSGAGPVCMEGLQAVPSSGGLYGLVLGLDPTLGTNTAIQPFTLKAGRIRSFLGGACVKVFAPDIIRPDVWHEFDSVQMWTTAGPTSDRFQVDPVAQMPIYVKRPMNRNVTENTSLMRDTSGANFTAPLVLQTAP